MKTLKFALLCAIFSTLVSVASAQESKKENSATKPAPRDKGWEKRHETFVGIAKRGNVDLLFLGDSITDAWGGEGHGMGGGHKIFTSKFVPMKAANFGIGGDRTQHVIWRLQNGELDGIKPKVVQLMIGTNNSNGSDNTAEEIADGVKGIIDEIKKKSPSTKVLLLAVFPRNTGKDDAAKKIQKDKIDKVNSIISKLDDGGKSVKFLDIGSKFKDASGALPKELMPDQLHLSEKGYEIWANAVEGVLTSMLKGDQTKAPEPTKTVKKVEPAPAPKAPEPTKTVKKVEPAPAPKTPEPMKTVKKVEPATPTTPAKPTTVTPEPTKTVKKVEPAPAPKTPEPVKETKKVEPAPAVKATAKSSEPVVNEEVVDVKKSPIRDFFKKLRNR
ncbi:MAG: GDSL-type esterase/lipase family protein [Gemmataceae bacterium]|jgi:lysophospholipase L1-like esterase